MIAIIAFAAIATSSLVPLEQNEAEQSSLDLVVEGEPIVVVEESGDLTLVDEPAKYSLANLNCVLKLGKGPGWNKIIF